MIHAFLLGVKAVAFLSGVITAVVVPVIIVFLVMNIIDRIKGIK